MGYAGRPMRPAAASSLAVDPHGVLRVADRGRGTIYRVQARGQA
jgi:hypothetical protein